MPKIPAPLTDTQIKKAKAVNKDCEILSDGGGLYLYVYATRRKVWILKYIKPNSKSRTNKTLGEYPLISLAQARAFRDEYKALLIQGIDPQEHQKELEQAEQVKLDNLFLSVAEKWKAKKAKEIELMTLQKNWRRLEIYVFPHLGQMAVDEIMPKTVIQSLEILDKQGKSDTLKRIVRLINEILNFAVNYGLLSFNPCLKVSEVFNFGKNQNNPTIRPEELPELLRKIQNSKLSLYTRCLIRWQLLTMTRPIETSSAEWGEIDLDKKLWTIPAEKMKTRKQHIIPLSTQALDILDIMRDFTANDKYIFQSARAKDKPMNSQTVNKALVDLGYKDRLTAHGLRSIASTYLNEQMINFDVIEACLSHGIKDQVRKAYNRSDYLEQRKPVMQLWGDYVEQCSKGI